MPVMDKIFITPENDCDYKEWKGKKIMRENELFFKMAFLHAFLIEYAEKMGLKQINPLAELSGMFNYTTLCI